MVFPDFDPVLIQIGPIAIRWYALAYVAGILLGWWYMLRLIRDQRLWNPTPAPIDRDGVDDLVLWATLGIIVGGRLGSVLFYDTDMIWTRPLDIFKVWRGGMSFHGGFIGVVLAVFFYSRAKKIDVLRLGDVVAPCVPFGLFFGRIANFINGELWGRPTDLPWGISPRAGDLPLHPSQLYEAALEGVALFIILRLATHKFGQLQRKGAVTGLFMLCYAIFRILVEQVRAPDAGLDDWPLGLTMGIVLSVPMALVGLWLIVRSRKDGELVATSPALAVASGAPVIEAVAPVAEAANPAEEPAPKPTPKAKAAPKLAAKPKAPAAPKTAPSKVASPKAATKAAPAKAPASKAAPAASKPKPAAKKPATKPGAASGKPAAKPRAKPKPKS